MVVERRRWDEVGRNSGNKVEIETRLNFSVHERTSSCLPVLISAIFHRQNQGRNEISCCFFFLSKVLQKQFVYMLRFYPDQTIPRFIFEILKIIREANDDDDNDKTFQTSRCVWPFSHLFGISRIYVDP